MAPLVFLLSLALHLPANEIASFSSAQEAFRSVHLCAGAVTVDDEFVARVTDDREVIITSIKTSRHNTLALQDRVIDLKIRNRILYVLTPKSIQEWNLEDGKLLHSVTSRNMGGATFEYRENAMGMNWHKDRLVIAHGRLGYSIYDTIQHRIVHEDLVLREQLPHESTLTDVVIHGDKAIFSVMGFTLSRPGQRSAFEGFLVLDLNQNKIVHAATGMDPGSETIDIIGDKVIVGFGGPIHSFLLKDVLSRPRARIQRILWPMPVPGSPMGQYAVEGTQIFSCFSRPATRGQPHSKIPLILDASAL